MLFGHKSYTLPFDFLSFFLRSAILFCWTYTSQVHAGKKLKLPVTKKPLKSSWFIKHFQQANALEVNKGLINIFLVFLHSLSGFGMDP